MIKVLICEDEYMIRKGLIFSIDWEKCGCIVIGESDNGEDGIQKIQELNPNIVITDINMPVCDGLTMIQKTYEEYDYSAIILSGYNEFEYAKQAIAMGVVEYLLKPVASDEMEKAIMRAIEQWKMRQYYHESNQMQILNDFLMPLSSDDELVHRMIDYIQQNYMKKLTMKELSEVFSFSETHLNNRFKEVCKTTFNDYLNKVRIQKAIEIMQKKGDYIYEIAAECGFSDYKYFSVVFRKYVGCSPKEFLKKNG